MFTTCRLTGAVSSYSPAASPRVRRRHSSWPPGRCEARRRSCRSCPSRSARTAAQPISTRLELVHRLRGFHHWFVSCTFPSRLPDPVRLAVPDRPVVVRAAPTLTRTSGFGLPSASPTCCDRLKVGPFTPPGHMAPHGAPPPRRRDEPSPGLLREESCCTLQDLDILAEPAVLTLQLRKLTTFFSCKTVSFAGVHF